MMDKRVKKAIKTTVIVLISPFILIFLAYLILYITMPISRSNESVREYVLDKIPIGTSREEAISMVDDHWKWEVEMFIDHGLRLHDNYTGVNLSRMYIEKNDIELIGEKTILVYLGEFYSPFHTAVFAYLAFDENDKLIEVGISRDVDAP